MATTTLVEAVRTALADEMRRDPTVWALGEDLERGGLFGQYRGLLAEFGPERIVSTPISEACIMGAGLGAALVGTRPVIELRMADFALAAFDELVNQIAKIRYMLGGQARAALVVRLPHGQWRNSAAQHSQCLEAWLAHLPGLVVLAPATPADAAGLLRAAIRSDDPVALCEPKALWGESGEVPDAAPPVPIGRARRVRAGSDVTLVAWSAVLPAAEEAARRSAADGISVDLLDLRSIWPWDRDMVLESVERTGRLLVAHEAASAGGFGAEIAATVAEVLADRPPRIRRLGAPRAPVPFSPPLENAIRVDAERIHGTIRHLATARPET